MKGVQNHRFSTSYHNAFLPVNYDLIECISNIVESNHEQRMVSIFEFLWFSFRQDEESQLEWFNGK